MTPSRRSQLVLSTLLLASSTPTTLSAATSSHRYLRSTSIQAAADVNLPWEEDETISSSGDNIPVIKDTRRRILSTADNDKSLPWEEDESSISSGDNIPTLADARRLQEEVAEDDEEAVAGIGLAQLIDRKPNKKKADPKKEPKALSIATTNITTEDNTTVVFATIIEDDDEEEEVTVNTTEATSVNITTNATLTNITKELRVEELIQEEEIYISQKCLNTLEASAGDNGRLGPEDYYIFTDGMSNGWFTLNNITSYDDLPLVNKFAFVTLSCQCTQFGGRDNCCQGPRANLNVQGINTTDVDSMNEQLKDYIIDICKTTIDAIGEDKMLDRPERDSSSDIEELPMEGWWDSPTSNPSSAPSLSVSPTNSPTLSPTVTPPFDGIVDNSGGGNSNDLSSSGLSGGAIAGIAIAAVVVLALIAYVLMPRKDKEEEDGAGESGDEFQLARIEDGNVDDDDLEQIEAGDNDDGSVVSNKELLAITNGEDATSSDNTAEF